MKATMIQSPLAFKKRIAVNAGMRPPSRGHALLERKSVAFQGAHGGKGPASRSLSTLLSAVLLLPLASCGLLPGGKNQSSPPNVSSVGTETTTQPQPKVSLTTPSTTDPLGTASPSPTPAPETGAITQPSQGVNATDWQKAFPGVQWVKVDAQIANGLREVANRNIELQQSGSSGKKAVVGSGPVTVLSAMRRNCPACTQFIQRVIKPSIDTPQNDKVRLILTTEQSMGSAVGTAVATPTVFFSDANLTDFWFPASSATDLQSYLSPQRSRNELVLLEALFSTSGGQPQQQWQPGYLGDRPDSQGLTNEDWGNPQGGFNPNRNPFEGQEPRRPQFPGQ